MKYDPVKKIVGSVAGTNRILRPLLYKLLGLFFLREWHVKRALRELMRRVPPPKSVLDAGSGFGQYTYYLAKRYPATAILAVDVKEEQIADCRRFFEKAHIANVRFAVADLLALSYDNEFDLVVSVDVMEHIHEDMTVFRNLHRALKPSGRLLVNTPSNLGGSDVHSPDDQSFVEEHARVGYGMDEIRSKLEATGFTVEHARYTYGRVGTMAWRTGIKYPLVMLNIHKAFFLLLPFYYLLTFPFTLCLMTIDYYSRNKRGTGLLVVARKP